MKILFIHALADPAAGGGAEVTLWTLMRAIRDLGHECVLLAASDREGLNKQVREGITVYSAKLANLYLPKYNQSRPALQKVLWHALDSANPFMQSFLKRVVAEERPDVASVHCLSGWSALSMRTLKRLSMPIVQVLHGYEYVCVKSSMYRGGTNCTSQCHSRRPFRLPHRRLSRYADAVVGVSRFILEKHRELGYFTGVAESRVMHNARDPEVLGVPGSFVPVNAAEMRFGYLGRLDEPKGVELLIDAFRLADIDNAKLLIAGSGKPAYVDVLRDRAAGLKVEFLGHVSPRQFLGQVHSLVVPSLWHEPLGMVVAEALAHGRPVIGSRRGGIPEMIDDGMNGLLFEPNDGPVALAQALVSMAGDRAAMDRMAEAACAGSRPFIDVKAWAEKYLELYRTVQHPVLAKVAHGA